MTDGIEAVTRSALALALDAASLRQQAIATNIANANAIGYVPQRVSFEEQLVDARRGMAQNGRTDAFAPIFAALWAYLARTTGDRQLAFRAE